MHHAFYFFTLMFFHGERLPLCSFQSGHTPACSPCLVQSTNRLLIEVAFAAPSIYMHQFKKWAHTHTQHKSATLVERKSSLPVGLIPRDFWQKPNIKVKRCNRIISSEHLAGWGGKQLSAHCYPGEIGKAIKHKHWLTAWSDSRWIV